MKRFLRKGIKRLRGKKKICRGISKSIRIKWRRLKRIRKAILMK